MSFNISDRGLLDSRFPLARTLHHVDLPAEQVHLKLHTETISSKGPGTRVVTQLRALGVWVVIDEFAGTGEIEHLGPDAIDLVKLDKQLVRDLDDDLGLARAELVIGSIIERGYGRLRCRGGAPSRTRPDPQVRLPLRPGLSLNATRGRRPVGDPAHRPGLISPGPSSGRS